MKIITLLFLFSIILASCGASKTVKKNDHKKPINSSKVAKPKNLKNLNSNYSGNISGKRESIIIAANQYIGTPYKYAGITKAGFDCSGLVCKVFEENSLKMPRRSQDQGKAGSSVEISKVKPGDLLFFATGSTSNVSHVGIVHDILSNGEITFIHASTSKGVMVSSLNESYWNKAFLFARSVL